MNKQIWTPTSLRIKKKKKIEYGRWDGFAMKISKNNKVNVEFKRSPVEEIEGNCNEVKEKEYHSIV